MTDTVTPITKNKEFVQPVVTDIRTCWEEVREGIQNILDRSPSLTYMPEDVYSECVNGRSMLFTSPLGFVVLMQMFMPIVILLFAPGFLQSKEKLDLAIGFSHNIVLNVAPEVKVETISEKGKKAFKSYPISTNAACIPGKTFSTLPL